MVQTASKTPRPALAKAPENKPAVKSRKLAKRPVSELSMRSPLIQPKLTVNAPGDRYEQEADAVASAVMSSPAPLPQPGLNRTSGLQRMPEENVVQRMPEEESIQRMREEPALVNEEDSLQASPDEDLIQRKGRGIPHISAATAATIRSPGAGAPLPGGIRQRIEPVLGASLSGVRVHTDASAQQASASLKARAFTHGDRIFLNSGESAHNLGLMAHEATHVVQQTGTMSTSQVARSSKRINTVSRKPLHSSVHPSRPKISSISTASGSVIQAKSEDETALHPMRSRIVEIAKSKVGLIEAYTADGNEKREIGGQTISVRKGGDLLLMLIKATAPQYATTEIQERDILNPSILIGPGPDVDPAPGVQSTKNSQRVPSWCGIFALWLQNQAGNNGGLWPGPWMGPKFGSEKLQFRDPGEKPLPGDVALQKGDRSHHGTVIEVQDNKIISIEGNTGPLSAIKEMTRSRSAWVGFARAVAKAEDTAGPEAWKKLNLPDISISSASGDASSLGEIRAIPPAVASQQQSESSSKTNVAQSVETQTEPQATDTLQPAAEQVGSEQASVPVEMAPASPESDPAFQAVVKRSKGISKQQRKHSTAKAEANKAQAAAVSPASEITSKAQDRQVQELDKQAPGTFNADAFVNELLKQIAKILPRSEKAADKFKDNNKLDSVRQTVSTKVSNEKQQAAAAIEKKNKAAPDKGGIEPKNVTPLVAAKAGSAPTGLKANKAAPKSKTDYEVSQPLQKNSQQLDQQMTTAEITDQQLAQSNEPQFTTALKAKLKAQDHAKTGPIAYRKEEKNILGQAENQAQQTGQQQLTAMHGQRGKLLGQVMTQQVSTKGQDEQARAKVATDINGIYEKTKTDVTTLLNGLDKTVTEKFDAGAKVAKAKFEKMVADGIAAFKENRYGAWYNPFGYGARIRDAIAGLPPEYSQIFVMGRDKYIELMKTTLRGIAEHVTQQLNAAKERIAKGRKEIKTYVDKLDPSLKEVGQKAAKDIQAKFDQLESQVKDKQKQLITSLTQKYKKNLKEIDARIEALKKENQGWIGQAKALLEEVTKTILKLRQMLLKVVGDAIATIQAILKNPIKFLSNLIAGVKQGFLNFMKKIGKHLQGGLIAWLTGTLGPIGIEMPKNVFSLEGIFSLVTQILGLTWDFVRRKAVKLFGEKTVAAMEKTVEIIQILRKDGTAGLWKYLKTQFNDLKKSVLDQIKQMVITQVITAGVKWLFGFLNPASAFVKAAMFIYDIVMFFVNQGSQILELVKTIVDSLAAIASGSVGAVAKKIEEVLVRILPVVIGFLASALGIGSLAKKVQEIVGRIRKRIEDAIDKLLLKIKKAFKKLVKKGKAAAGKVLQWWKKKKKFKNKSGKEHTLFFKGKGKTAKLYMRSKEISVLNEIRKLKRSKVEKDKKLGEKLEIKVTALNDEIAKFSTKQSTPGEEKAFQNKIAMDLAQISAQLAKISETDLPATSVTYIKQGSKAGSVTAWPLTKIAGNTKGSEPTEDPPGWDLVRTFDYEEVEIKNKTTGKVIRTQEVPVYWRRFHLLNNEKMHGPGKAWNLVPAHQKDNSIYLHEIEAPMDKKINDNDSDILYFKVRVAEYHSQAPAGDKPESIDEAARARFDALYTNFPAKLIIDAGYLLPTANGFSENNSRGKIFDNKPFEFKGEIDVTLENKNERPIILGEAGRKTLESYGIEEWNARFLAKHAPSLSSVSSLVDAYFTQDEERKIETVISYLNNISSKLSEDGDGRPVILFKGSNNSSIKTQISGKIATLIGIQSAYSSDRVRARASTETRENLFYRGELSPSALARLLSQQIGVPIIFEIRGIKFSINNIPKRDTLRRIIKGENYNVEAYVNYMLLNTIFFSAES